MFGYPKYRIKFGFYVPFVVERKDWFLGFWELLRCCDTREQAYAVVELSKRMDNPNYGPKGTKCSD